MPLSGGRADRGIPLPGSATPDCLNRRRVRTSPLKIRLQMVPPCTAQCLLFALSWHSHRGPEKRKQCMNAWCEMAWAAPHTRRGISSRPLFVYLFSEVPLVTPCWPGQKFNTKPQPTSPRTQSTFERVRRKRQNARPGFARVSSAHKSAE